jgi:signal transduction histidine kinase
MPTRDSGEVMRTIYPEGHPFAVAVHRPRLEESPELVQAMVATSLLLCENATLEVELRSAICDLEDSRARIVKAGDRERRRIERDLHDGAQQRLIALGIKLQSVSEMMEPEAPVRQRIANLCLDVDQVLVALSG